MRKSASRTREFGVAAYIAMLLVDAKVVGDIWPRRVIPGEQAEFRLCPQGFASTMRRPRGELSDRSIRAAHRREAPMPQTEEVASHSIDTIAEQLDRFRQRATYGAVAAVLNRSPRNLMSGRTRSQRDSWIVSNKDGMPTGYEPHQVHPEITSRELILRSAEDLGSWLESPS